MVVPLIPPNQKDFEFIPRFRFDLLLFYASVGRVSLAERRLLLLVADLQRFYELLLGVSVGGFYPGVPGGQRVQVCVIGAGGVVEGGLWE